MPRQRPLSEAEKPPKFWCGLNVVARYCDLASNVPCKYFGYCVMYLIMPSTP